jgi:hypothetical protein
MVWGERDGVVSEELCTVKRYKVGLLVGFSAREGRGRLKGNVINPLFFS